MFIDLDFKKFIGLDDPAKSYYIPSKKEWGMDPSENQIWTDFEGVKKDMAKSMEEKQAMLCWQKHEDSFSSFFIVWW